MVRGQRVRGPAVGWTGLATVAAAIIFHLLPVDKVDTYAVAVTAVMLFSLTVAVVQSFRYLYVELPESGGRSRTGEHANEIEKP
jgi:hypothetical protein